MIGLAAFLAKLFPALAGFFMWTFHAWHLAALAGAVAIVTIFLDKILLVLAWFGGMLIERIIYIGSRLLIYLVSALPHVPEDFPTVAWENITNLFGLANRYLPVDVAFSYLGIVVGVYSMILGWKLIRFIRGGA